MKVFSKNVFSVVGFAAGLSFAALGVGCAHSGRVGDIEAQKESCQCEKCGAGKCEPGKCDCKTCAAQKCACTKGG